MSIYKNTNRLIFEYLFLHNSVVKKSLTTEPTKDKLEENAGTYEVTKNLFGKEKVRKVKDESRTLGIEYTTR